MIQKILKIFFIKDIKNKDTKNKNEEIIFTTHEEKFTKFQEKSPLHPPTNMSCLKSWYPPLQRGGGGGRLITMPIPSKASPKIWNEVLTREKSCQTSFQKCLLNTQRKSVFQWARILTTSLALLDKVQGCHALSIIYWNFLWLSSNHFIHVSLLKSASQDVTLIWQNCSWI